MAGSNRYLEFVNPEAARLLRSKIDTETAIARRKEHVAAQTAQCLEYEQSVKFVNEVLLPLIDRTQHSRVHYTVDSLSSTLAYDISNGKDHINQYLGSIATYTEMLATIEEKLANSTNTTRINTTKAKADIGNLANVNKRSIGFRLNSEGVPFLRWVFEGVIMQPDSNPYPSIIALGELPNIPLQPIVVSVNLNDGEMTVSTKPAFSVYSRYRYSGNRNTPHPHIMAQKKPCLGDFRGPIREAIHEQDFITLVTLTRMFLERAITDDAAGNSWTQYFAKDVTSYHGYFHNNFEYLTANGKAYKFREIEPGMYNVETYDNHALIDTRPHSLNGLF
jgi:hypothetical protein